MLTNLNQRVNFLKIFDSRNPVYKNPTGAVAENTQVHFKVCLPRYISASGVDVMFKNEHTGETEVGNMFWCGMEGRDHEWWEVDFTPKSAGLWHYHFELDCVSSARRIGRDFGSVGILTVNPSPWQMTVYEEGFETPDWLEGGIIYQIFPDRFACSGKTRDVFPDRVMHKSWDEEIVWQPDEKGRVLNNDYYGGDLRGIIEHLDRLEELGVTCLYLNPIFESHENHRYATACYERTDPLLGTEQDFMELCEKCHSRGIKVILDGVFSHTGADSVYFNKYKRYRSIGAYNSQKSPYYDWFTFKDWPDRYCSWWDFDTLPEVQENTKSYIEYICGENGILRRWLKFGADGWRLDVADELPDVFLDELRKAVKAENPQAIIMGEVWEDASNKVAYGSLRRYFGGRQLDTVMNYVFKDAILGLVTGWDAKHAMECILCVMENYPPQVIPNLMNLIGSHDTMRALTLLGGEPLRGRDRAWQAANSLSDEQMCIGKNLLRLATVMQYTLPGVPSIYYGDEVGMQGYKDPFCRRTYPWGREDTELFEWFAKLGKLRRSLECLKNGSFEPVYAKKSTMAYIRRGSEDAILVAVNAAWNDEAIELPSEFVDAKSLHGIYNGGKHLIIPATSAAILRIDLTEEKKTVGETQCRCSQLKI